MAGNPFDFNRDGRWSTSERAFTHYGIDPLMRGERGGGSGSRPAGCGSGCLGCLTLLALCGFVYLGWLVVTRILSLWT